MEILKRRSVLRGELYDGPSVTDREKIFLQNVTLVSRNLNNDSMEEWTSTTDKQLDKLMEFKFFGDCPDAKETAKIPDFLKDLMIQKFNKLNCGAGRMIHFGILNAYGFQDLEDGPKFFKIPVVKIMTSDYLYSYFMLMNGLGFDDLKNVFNVIEGMPYSTICVPSSYSIYVNNILMIENEMSLFKTKNNIHPDIFKACSIEIDFKTLVANLNMFLNDMPEEMEEEEYQMKKPDKPIFETATEMIEKLTAIIETNSSETKMSIEDYTRIETFVYTSIQCAVVKKLNYKWDRFINIWMNKEDEKIELAKYEVGNELSEKIDKGFINEIFKQYWLSKRKLLFISGDEEERIYSFSPSDTEKISLKPFIDEIKNDSDFVIVDFVGKNIKYKTVKFFDDKSFNIVFNEVIPGQTLGFMVVKSPAAFFSKEEKLTPLSTVFNREVIDGRLQREVVIHNEKMFLNLEEENLYLLKFYYLAREEQEFIANTQGHFNPRILLKPDEETLKKFVRIALFGLDGPASLEKMKVKNSDRIVQRIARKIIKMNKKFEKERDAEEKNSIFYDAVYIYGFKTTEEDKGKFYRIPVFKIYKNKNDSDPAFLDVDLNGYKNWKDFLDHNVLKKDLICVPKNGRYFNDLTNEIELEFLRNNPIFWTNGRIIATTVHVALFTASTVLAFWTGPIGWGARIITIAEDVRLIVSGTGIILGITGVGLSLSVNRFSNVNNKLQIYGGNTLFALEVITEVLTIFGGTSVFAQVAAGALTAGSICFGGFLVCKLILDIIYKYRETGEFSPWDLTNLASSALLFGNSVMQIGKLKSFLMSCGDKMPMLQRISSSDMQITTEVGKPNQWGRFLMSQAGNIGSIGMIQNLIGCSIQYYKKEKTLEEFLSVVKDFVEELVLDVVGVIEPFLLEFLKNKLRIDLAKINGNKTPISKFCRLYIKDFFAFIINGVKHGKELMKTLFASDDLTSRMLEPNENLENAADTVTRRLAIEGPVNLESPETIEKMLKAEDFVQSAIFEKEIKKLKCCFNSDNDQDINLELIKKETVEEILNEDHDEFKKQFEEHCSGYDKVILLHEEEKSKIYIFKYESDDDLLFVLRQEDENIIDWLVRTGEKTYEYKGSDKNVFVCLKNDDPENDLWFLLVFYN